MSFVFQRLQILQTTLTLACMIGSISDGRAEATRLSKPLASESRAIALFVPYSGHYYVRGIREVGTELTLNVDGQFNYLMSYGAVDSTAKGRWTISGSRITLTTDPTQPASLKLSRVSDVIASPYSDPGEKRTQLVVEVVSPKLGIVWSNMLVTAEFSNEKQRSGLTGRNGMIGFDQRDDDGWKDALITRVKVEYPRVKADSGWFDVIANRTRTMTFSFEPGELMPPPFKSLELEVETDPNDVVSLTLMKENGEPVKGVKFTR